MVEQDILEIKKEGAGADIQFVYEGMMTKGEMVRVVEATLPSYPYDHFRYYPATAPGAWQAHFLQRLQNPEITFFSDVVDDLPVLIGVKMAQWDREHFGFGVAAIDIVHSHETPSSNSRMGELLTQCIGHLRDLDIRFVSARVNGDMVPTLHLFESLGFRYVENIIWPVARCNEATGSSDSGVRLMREEDLPHVVRIADNFQYQRGHFHSDSRFDRKKVDQLYARWIKTSWMNKEPIAVIEHEGKVAGYFNFKMDGELSKVLGYSYGRLRSLALDGTLRGKGLGQKLFQGTMSLIVKKGGEYIDSGYATKNHASAKLHTLGGFYSAYEEVTLHLWF